MQTRLKKLFIQFAIYCCSDVLAFSALNFTLNLQSSINVEDGLGTKALAVAFSSAIGFGLLLTPLILRKLGPKIGLIISVSMMTIFIASNYYPAYATMIPAAILLGLSEGTIWPSMVLMNVYFGTEYSNIRNRPEMSQNYVNIFSGCFFTVHHLNQVFGGIAGYLLLGGTRGNASNYQGNATDNITGAIDSFAFCGSSDCQIDSELNEIITNYTPTNRYKFIIMITIFVAMSICSIILYACVLPNPLSKSSRKENGQSSDAKCYLKAPDTTSLPSATQEDNASVNFIEKSTEKKTVKGMAANVFTSVREIVKQLLRPKQLLIIPITFYHGLLTSFLLSEVPRAYVSCVKGFASISLYSCVFGFSHVSSCIVGRFTKRIGRVCILTVAMILDAVNLLFCLLWIPDLSTSWMIYISYFLFGMTDGTWQLTLNLTHVAYFPTSREEAGSVWATMLNLGLAVQFAWSTALCEYVKIYIMIGTLIAGVIMFHFAERMNKKEMTPNL